jgi:arylsulfatase A-like enzyme
MIRPLFLFLSAWTLSCVALHAKPNFVFILADDLGRMDTTPYGSTFHETPNIQRLADSGMRFINAHSTSPVCSPARASIMTGLYAERLGMTQPACHIPLESLKATLPERNWPWFKAISPMSTTRLHTNFVTFAEILQEHGYRTGHIGKWHLGPEPYSPLQHGFDTDFPHTAAHGPIGSYFGPAEYSETFTLGKGEHLDDKLAERAVEFIQANQKHPFFLNYWAFSVHAPPFAKPHLIEKYRQKAAELPADARQRNPLRAAMIETFDDHVGMILDSIEEAGLAGSTIVILCSDNGAEVSSPYSEEAYWGNGTKEEILRIPLTATDPLRGEKGTVYDGGTAVPCLVRWPGEVRRGSVSDALFSGADFFPTFLEMAGVDMPGGLRLDGVSQVPALLENRPPRRVLYGFWTNYIERVGAVPAAWIREGDYKLIRYFADGPDQSNRHELYHVAKDPGETNDLAGQMPERVEELSKKLTRHFEDTEAVIPVPNPGYDPDAVEPDKKQG